MTLSDARAAFDRSEWPAAFEAFSAADVREPLTVDDLERAALAAMWIGEADACIDFRQRAFGLRAGAGETRRAAGLAMDLCFDYAGRHRAAVALGWGKQAERLLEGCEPCAELGRLEGLRAVIALHVNHDVEAAAAHYEETMRMGRLLNNADLIAEGLAGSGEVLVRQGRVHDGLQRIDEAMISAISGLLGSVMTARIYCITISQCQALGDIRRASEWTEQAVACSTRPGMGDFPGDCRMHRAEITRLRGDWASAESELRAAMVVLERYDTGHVGQAWYELGEIELRRGDLAAAADAFDRSAACGKDPQPGLAMLRLAEGDDGLASAQLRSALANVGDSDPLAVGQLLPALVVAQLACGDVTGAAESAERLAEIARVYPTVLLQARAAMSRALVAAASGSDADAVEAARNATHLWREAGAPYETAQAQQLLAEVAARSGDREVAIVELEAALAVFRELGARRDVESATIQRDRLGDLAVGHQVRRTFMFTDIVDSTPLVAQMGDEAWTAVLRAHDRTIRDALAPHRGTEVKQRGGGDGFFAVFESASDGVACAIEIQQALERQRSVAFVPGVRIGVHEAEALLCGSDFAGLGVHEAARIGAFAGAGEVLASRATVEAAGVTAVTPVREVELKGLSASVAVQGIRWQAPDDAEA
jgi:class 3 adenylate cyclase